MTNPEHSHHIEILVDEVWRSVHRLQGASAPSDLHQHLETLETAEATLSAILAQIKRKKAA